MLVDEVGGSGPSDGALLHHWNCFDRAGEEEIKRMIMNLKFSEINLKNI